MAHFMYFKIAMHSSKHRLNCGQVSLFKSVGPVTACVFTDADAISEEAAQKANCITLENQHFSFSK